MSLLAQKCLCHDTIIVMPTSISLDAAVVVTGSSKRTIWRRVSDGGIRKITDAGSRAMLSFEDIEPMLAAPMTAKDKQLLLAADAGDAEAQDDMGQFFLAAKQYAAARYWLELAVKQDYPNAMHVLGRSYLAGDCVPKDQNLGVMWIAKAAAHGHAIAQEQMRRMLGNGPASAERPSWSTGRPTEDRTSKKSEVAP